MVSLKPSDFFTANPALDVPASTQLFNQSKLFSQKPSTPQGVLQGNAEVEAEAKANGLGKSCCAETKA